MLTLSSRTDLRFNSVAAYLTADMRDRPLLAGYSLTLDELDRQQSL
ncbi:hypothetical protein ACVNIS_11210 [Sphaerotilaceae bacterium SBD11-9]